MPQINIPQLQKTITVPVGTKLMQALLDAGIPVASSCGGEGVCGKCKIKIVAGQDQLAEPNETELFVQEINDISAPFRVSCQVEVLGDISVEATYW